MRKWIRLAIVMVCLTMLLPGHVQAANRTVSTEQALRQAVSAGGTVVLASDIQLTRTLTVTSSVTLRLDGHTLSGARSDLITVGSWLRSGSLTVRGPGTASGGSSVLSLTRGSLNVYNASIEGRTNVIVNNSLTSRITVNGSNITATGGSAIYSSSRIGGTVSIGSGSTIQAAGTAVAGPGASRNVKLDSSVTVIDRDHPAVHVHAFGPPAWEWDEGEQGRFTVTAVFTCQLDPSHTERVEALVTSEITPATFDTAGSVVYTAAVPAERSPDGRAYSDVRTVTLPALSRDITDGLRLRAVMEDGSVFVSVVAAREVDLNGLTGVFRYDSDAFTLVDTLFYKDSSAYTDFTLWAVNPDNGMFAWITLEDDPFPAEADVVTLQFECGDAYAPGQAYTFDLALQEALVSVDNEILNYTWSDEAVSVTFRQTCQVTFGAGGGSEVEGQTVGYGEQVQVPDPPVRSGYRFDGWLLAGEPYDFDSPVTGDLTLTASWTAAGGGRPGGTGSPAVVGIEDEEVPLAELPTVFEDVSPEDWFYESVYSAYALGLMKGDHGLFDPQGETTRGMVVTILYRLEEQPEAERSSFSDVSGTAYYADAVGWASGQGIVLGYGDGIFRPDQAVSRQELAVILYRYAAYKDRDTSDPADLSAYADADQVDDWALQAVQWANGSGLMTGVSESRLAPDGTTTRAQLATVLVRLVQYFAPQSDAA